MPRLLAAGIIPLGAIAFGLFSPANSDELWLPCGIGGALVGCLYWHAYRGLGLAAFAIAASCGICAVAALINDLPEVANAAASALLGLALARLLIANLHSRSGFGWVAANFAIIAAGIVVGSCAARNRPSPFLLVGFAFFLTVLAGIIFFRPAFEFAVEPLLWLMYHIRGIGPGLEHFPRGGSCLVVANHACWFDPLFLAKVLPRPITPMMTSRFYDKPVLHWLCKRVFHAIRVPDLALKQDVPAEIGEAIAALDRGECVVIFPEGFLRRSDEKPLRRFGRGVWQILAARPTTPVVACWIEGGWGSFCSYWNGNPTRGKRLDFRRRIGVALSAPRPVEPDLLANHLDARIALMNRTIAARTLLGLPEAAGFELPHRE